MSETLIPNLPPSFQQAKGVVMSPPPAHMLAKTDKLISDAVKTLRADENGALTWIAHRQGGQTSINLALVKRVNDRFEAVAYFGKTWGEPFEAGIAGRINF